MLVDDVEGLETPDLESGQEAEQSVDEFDSLSAEVEKVKETAEDATLGNISQAVSAISASFSAMREQISTAFTTLEGSRPRRRAEDGLRGGRLLQRAADELDPDAHRRSRPGRPRPGTRSTRPPASPCRAGPTELGAHAGEEQRHREEDDGERSSRPAGCRAAPGPTEPRPRRRGARPRPPRRACTAGERTAWVPRHSTRAVSSRSTRRTPAELLAKARAVEALQLGPRPERRRRPTG